MRNQNNLKVLKSSDQVSVVFGQFFDRFGSTYQDCEITINEKTYLISYYYGRDTGNHQIKKNLSELGYRVRNTYKDNFHKNYKNINTEIVEYKKKSQLNKENSSYINK